MSGVFLDLAPGYYDIKFKKVDNKITVSLSIGKNSTNDIKDLIRL
jgi:hypothetical protein